ncbi:LCP family protein [Brevibacterium sp.]|uniref:LCP family protein n=1 Tax=Brevibacterium sp. TaxID=1701 RepID=UPI0025BB9EF9|nr:LCP family protein [Brevibacterium sp.]
MSEVKRTEHRLRIADPLRNPTRLDAAHRDVRGWVLLLATVLLPGSVQSYFRSRRSRIALGITLVVWVCALLALVLVLVRRQFAFSLATNPILLPVVLLVVAVGGVNWLLCLLDTVRLVRLHTLSRRARPRFLAAALAAVLLVTGGTAYAGVMVNSQRGLMSELFASGKAAKPVDGRYNILLLGSDAGKGRQGIRPDSITLVSIDAKTGAAVMVGLPRNMQNVPFPEGTPLAGEYPQGFDCGDECLLNAVYQAGEEHADAFPDAETAGVQAMKDAVTGVTGLEAQYYAMIDLQGFEDLIDAMGGITVVSQKRVPISSKVDPATGKHGPVKGWIEPGEQKLDGYHALWFARSREFSSDYERMVRQRCVQDAMLRQLNPQTVLLRFQDIAKAAPEVVSTDIPQVQVDDFVDLALKTRAAGTTSVDLTPPEVNPTHPDFDSVRALVAETVEKSQASAEETTPAAAPAPAGSLLMAPGAVLTAGPATALAAGAEDGGGSGDGGDEEICSVP